MPPTARGTRTPQPSRDSAGRSADDTEIPQPPPVKNRAVHRAEADPALAETQDMDPVEVEPPPVRARSGADSSQSKPRLSFGQAAVMLKLVSASQIQECVNLQRAQMNRGERVMLLGELLRKRGYITADDVEKVRQHQQLYQIADQIPGYRIVNKLGQGAMGAVYKARQVSMDRWVAIKILQPELAANAHLKARFLQEARASARLNHPNVITGIDAGEVAGLSYFAMEYVEGKTLSALVRERGPMDERIALEILVQVAKALEHAEKHALVHRDVKPDNIMVTRERVAKLLDLGLAKMRAEKDAGAARGMAVGTPNYISPEQAMGRQDIDSRSDLYSLGVTLYFVLTGRVPFDGTPEVVMYKHIHEPPPHPRNYRPDLSEGVSTLMFHLMAKRAEDRPASAAQLVSDIEHLLRTGNLPGYGQTPRSIGNSGRQAHGGPPRGHGARPSAPPGPPPRPAQNPSDDSSGVRLPRKRRKRYGGW